MKTLALIILIPVLLSSCNTTTTVTTQQGGKTVTTVTEKRVSEGVLTAGINAVLGGFITVFEPKP